MILDELSQKLVPSELPRLSGNVYCIGRNYGAHAKELGNEIPKEPVVFLKAPSALRPLSSPYLACADESFHHEIEIVLMIGSHIPMGTQAPAGAVAGITLGLDLTRRAVQTELKSAGLPWTLSKSFAGSGLLHRFQKAPSEIGKLSFVLKVNGETRQTGHSEDMIFKIPAILSFLLKYQDLHPGDLIYTGTPEGVAAFKKGDRFQLISPELKIEAEGVL